MFLMGLLAFVVGLAVAACMLGFIPNIVSIPVGEQAGFLIVAVAIAAVVIGAGLMVGAVFWR